jgi:hypothetical protein
MNKAGSEQSAEAPYRPVGPARRRRSSNALHQLLHRALLWAVLGVGAAAPFSARAPAHVQRLRGAGSGSIVAPDRPPRSTSVTSAQ